MTLLHGADGKGLLAALRQAIGEDEEAEEGEDMRLKLGEEELRAEEREEMDP